MLPIVHVSGPHDINIGRPSIWGNPFVLGRHGNRAQVIEWYERRVRNSPGLLKRLEELRGKVLACHCGPHQPCHGDVLVKLLKERFPND